MTDLPMLSPEVALKVGLAARVLPGVAPGQLLELLIREVGLPLSDQRLAGLKARALKTALEALDLPGPISMEAVKQAVGQLKAGQAPDDLPTPQPYEQGDMPGSIRVACASNSAELDGHFGSCLHFLIYQVSATEHRLIDVRDTHGDGEAEDRNAFRADLLGDCQVLVVQSIGGPAAARVVRSGVHPIKPARTQSLESVLGDLQNVLSGHPPPWLAKAMGQSTEERVRFSTGERP